MILDFHYQVVQLNQLDWRAFLQSSNPVAAALMARMRIAPGERWRVKAASLRLLVGIRLTGQQRLLISQFVDLYLPLQRHEEQAFQAEVSTFTPQEQESVMEVVTSWERKGHIKGRAEGRAEGQRQIVEQLLVYKMGQLPEALSQRLVTLTSEQLTSLATALLEFTQLADLEGWLDGQPTAEPPAAGTTPIPTHMDRPKEP